MGKYVRKVKLSGEVAVMEASHQPSLGVCTRARALAALQKLTVPDATIAHLELRSRLLEKPLPPSSGGSQSDYSEHNSESAGSVSLKQCWKTGESVAPETGASLGENAPESKMRQRFVMETTPCSPIRDSQTGSTARPIRSTLANRRMHNHFHLKSPTALEIEGFFASAEQLQQRLFIEKYNFDPVNDKPLSGRYEWLKLY